MSDTNKRIIYKEDDGSVSIIVPANKSNRTIEQLAKKTVPTGKKYKIVATSTISSDRTFRDAWEVDEALLTDGVGK